jgi:hypothetical protein
MAKKVAIVLWLDDDEEVNDANVGKALGEVILEGRVYYEQMEATQ